MTDATFLNLVRGNRLSAMMGLNQHGVSSPKYGPDYQYVEIPVSNVKVGDEVLLPGGKVSRNQHAEIVPACTINVRGKHPVLVVYNNQLQTVASLGSMTIVHPGSGELMPSFWATFRKDYDIANIEWAIRLYMFS